MTNRSLRPLPLLVITLIVIAIAPALLWLKKNSPLVLELFEREAYNQELGYQL